MILFLPTGSHQSDILSLTSSRFSVYHLVWHWLLTLLCTVAVKMQISQDSAFLFCRQFTVWRPRLLAAEQRTRVSAISILLSLGKMPQYLSAQTAALLSTLQRSGGDQRGYKQLALGSLMFEALTLFVCTSDVLSGWQLKKKTLSCAVSSLQTDSRDSFKKSYPKHCGKVIFPPRIKFKQSKSLKGRWLIVYSCHTVS